MTNDELERALFTNVRAVLDRAIDGLAPDITWRVVKALQHGSAMELRVRVRPGVKNNIGLSVILINGDESEERLLDSTRS